MNTKNLYVIEYVANPEKSGEVVLSGIDEAENATEAVLRFVADTGITDIAPAGNRGWKCYLLTDVTHTSHL